MTKWCFSDRAKLACGIFLALVALGFVTPLAQAQNPNLAPTYGSVGLRCGFLPDPYSRLVVAGGPLFRNHGAFDAYIASPPDFVLDYTAGILPLTIYAQSSADTTLLIRCPDGTWVADDDSGGNLNPLIRFANPQSGRYHIWVGTIGRNTANATLRITELK